MNLEDVMISEISQALQKKHCIISLMWNLKKPSYGSRENGGCQGLGQELGVKGHEVLVREETSSRNLLYTMVTGDSNNVSYT
jgi:hypothetical protein